ncbi:UNVERIFIED_CONTAM: hypothetical protein Slati_2902500 [Sesamum latifolium]|uniref:Uncharacterized protein n=1 Tax=Sesamum latifolium TaxID=2727402 RepID=A0AAW2VGK0_9LAMI
MVAGGPMDGDSGRARCAHARATRTIMEIDDKVSAGTPAIQFGPADTQGVHLPHNDALIISATIANYTVQRIFVDSDMPSAYILILGRSTLNVFQAIISTYYMKLKFPIRNKIGEVQGDQYTARRCYVEAIKSGSNKMEIDRPSQEDPKTYLHKRSNDNADIFAWTANDLTGIDPSVIVHTLNVDPTYPPVKQKKRHFGPAKDKVIQDEGYHQIMLNPDDQKRVSFITSGGTYCYVVMPFGLKNAGATYQRLVDRMFKGQLGRNMEVYVDDMLEMKPPTNLNEVQRLAGRITALSRFISRSTEWSLPFFKALRKTKNFTWDEECQQAFQELKVYLAQLLLLTKPVPGSGAGVVLTSPERDGLEYALHFDFKASNNEVEYDALIAGIKMALDAGAEDLIAYTDSQLVTKQVEGEYKVKEGRMKEYLQEISELISRL